MREDLKTLSDHWANALNEALSATLPENVSGGLYEPIGYFYQLGGKRMRPMLAYLGASLYTNHWQSATPAALAVEIFHNFTLVHDDIMDKAPLRRGQITVHEKWDTATAILVGDRMMIAAYEGLNKADKGVRSRLHKVLNRAAAEICEGQMEDMQLENDNHPTLARYIEMIRKKTAVLLGAALQMGALSGGAEKEDAKKLYQYGVKAGLGFQIMDDYLDVFGEADFGKQKAGDIISGKRSYLVCRIMNELDEAKGRDFMTLLNDKKMAAGQKISAVIAILKAAKVDEAAKEVSAFYFKEADKLLKNLNADKQALQNLKDYVKIIRARQV